MENIKCEYKNCSDVATTKKTWQPPRIVIKPGFEQVPNKVVLNVCESCAFVIDIREYGTN